MRWECELPLRANHHLAPEAAAELARLLPGRPVYLAANDSMTARLPRPWRTVIGKVIDATVIGDDRVKVTLRVGGSPALMAALGSGRVGFGMDVRVRVSSEVKAQPGEEVLITGVHDAYGVEAVPAHCPSEWGPPEPVPVSP